MSNHVSTRSHGVEVAKAHASRIAAGNAARFASAGIFACLPSRGRAPGAVTGPARGAAAPSAARQGATRES